MLATRLNCITRLLCSLSLASLQGERRIGRNRNEKSGVAGYGCTFPLLARMLDEERRLDQQNSVQHP